MAGLRRGVEAADEADPVGQATRRDVGFQRLA